MTGSSFQPSGPRVGAAVEFWKGVRLGIAELRVGAFDATGLTGFVFVVAGDTVAGVTGVVEF
ncbi:MAG: hypothetical protein B6D39_11765 [Anaerolineae bacterium UTCFX2]|nr:MAG: hypothetical protein B6D39_11765 [Anaerolineae bacterium UTCFX2]